MCVDKVTAFRSAFEDIIELSGCHPRPGPHCSLYPALQTVPCAGADALLPAIHTWQACLSMLQGLASPASSLLSTLKAPVRGCMQEQGPTLVTAAGCHCSAPQGLC